MLKNYCEIEDIENYLLLEIDSAFEPQVEEWMEAQEAYIDQETGRNFKADSIASERLFDGDGERMMFIDDAVEITKVEVDGVEVDYYAYPANSLPKTSITLEDGFFTKGNQNITVTAKWGYSVAVPADIKLACTVLVAGIINEGANSEGEIKSLSMGAYNVTYRDKKQVSDFENIKETLKKYQRMTI